MISKRPLAFATGVLLTAAISVAVYSARSGLLAAPPSVRADQAVSSAGDSPVWQQRIDDYIARVGKEDFETLVKNLNRHEDLLVIVGGWSQGGAPRNMFAVCLADRRLAKIFAELESRPAAEADRLCRSIFEEKFNTQKSMILKSRAIWEKGLWPTAPRPTEPRPTEPRPVEPRPMGENLTALCGAVFLSARFCPVSEVLRQLGEWQELGRSTQRRLDAVPGVSSLGWLTLEDQAFPESVFLLNVYSWMLRDRCGDSDFEELLPEHLPTERVAFRAWDARRPKQPNFRGRQAEVPGDKERGLMELTFHGGWDFSSRSEYAKKRNAKLLASLRQRLEKHAADDAD